MAVRAVRIERDVGDDVELADVLFQRANGALEQAVGVDALAPLRVLQRLREGRESATEVTPTSRAPRARSTRRSMLSRD